MGPPTTTFGNTLPFFNFGPHTTCFDHLPLYFDSPSFFGSVILKRSSPSTFLNGISLMLIIRIRIVNNFVIPLKDGIPMDSHNFNGLGHILPDSGLTPQF